MRTLILDLPISPTLRRSNRIRTIHASLAIEQNTLNLEQVTAVLSGKTVLAPQKDIVEVKNAYEIYEHMINASNTAGDSTVFLEFMLSAIKASLTEASRTSDEMSDVLGSKEDIRWRAIAAFLEDHPHIMNADLRALLAVAPATANRILSGFVAEGKLTKIRVGGHWGYRWANEGQETIFAHRAAVMEAEASLVAGDPTYSLEKARALLREKHQSK